MKREDLLTLPRPVWSAVTCYRFHKPRLVAAVSDGNRQPRGDKSPLNKALTSQRTPKKVPIGPTLTRSGSNFRCFGQAFADYQSDIVGGGRALTEFGQR